MLRTDDSLTLGKSIFKKAIFIIYCLDILSKLLGHHFCAEIVQCPSIIFKALYCIAFKLESILKDLAGCYNHINV